jgi:hypothetical protein
METTKTMEKHLIDIWKNTKDFVDINYRAGYNYYDVNTYYNQSKLDTIYDGKIPSTSSTNPIIEVVNRNPFEVVKSLVNQKYKTLLMNPSRPYSHGGGVNYGYNNFEAEIYRRTSLTAYINNHNQYMYYPLDGKKGILTKGVLVFRDTKPDYKYLSNDSYHVDIFTQALPDNPIIRTTNYVDNYVYDSQEKSVEEIIQLFFEVAFLNNYRALVLTDIGCREQNHPIEIVAKIIKQKAHKYRYYFDKIIIAVEGDVNDVKDKYCFNYDFFKYIFDNQESENTLIIDDIQDDELL